MADKKKPSPELLEMLKLSPKNPALRTQVHACMLVPIPDELETFEQISKWLGEEVVPSEPLVRVRDGCTFVVDVETTVHGRATYYAVERGQGTWALTSEQLTEALQQAMEEGRDLIATLQLLSEFVEGAIRDDGGMDVDTYIDPDSYEYDDHEQPDHDSPTYTARSSSLQQFLRRECATSPALAQYFRGRGGVQ